MGGGQQRCRTPHSLALWHLLNRSSVVPRARLGWTHLPSFATPPTLGAMMTRIHHMVFATYVPRHTSRQVNRSSLPWSPREHCKCSVLGKVALAHGTQSVDHTHCHHVCHGCDSPDTWPRSRCHLFLVGDSGPEVTTVLTICTREGSICRISFSCSGCGSSSNHRSRHLQVAWLAAASCIV